MRKGGGRVVLKNYSCRNQRETCAGSSRPDRTVACGLRRGFLVARKERVARNPGYGRKAVDDVGASHAITGAISSAFRSRRAGRFPDSAALRAAPSGLREINPVARKNVGAQCASSRLQGRFLRKTA